MRWRSDAWVVAVSGALLIAACAGSVATGADASPGEQEGRGRYIVVLEDSVEHPGELARAQTEQHDGELGFVYRHALDGYSAILPRDEVSALRKDPHVAYVAVDQPVHAFEGKVELETYDNQGAEVFGATIPTGISRTFAAANKRLSIDGQDNVRANVDVAVIDTGIDQTHPDLDVEARTTCISGSCVDGSGEDDNSHGTHVAGTIGAIDNGVGVVGVAPGARLWAVKVLNEASFGYESWIAAGIDWVSAHAKDIEVANMSLGCTCAMPAVDKAINSSVEAGVVYVVAAGNSGADAKYVSPANNPNVITVSALADYDGKTGGKATSMCENYGLDDRLASFSNYGTTVEIAAPGTCILSTEPHGQYGYKSGTSMASPHVAGAAAILASKSNPNSKKDVEAIRSTLIKAGNSGWTDTSGDGVQEPLLDVSNEATFGLPMPPKASTGSATGVSAGIATLKATVNPEGTNASYQFEYGKTSAYGSKVPVSAKAIGSGTSDVSVSEAIGGLEPSTSYHFRVVASNEVGTTNGEDATFRTDAAVSTTKLGGMATTEPFDGGTASLASFGANWSALGWAAGSPAKGEDTSTGWRPVAAYPSNHGASYNPTITDTGLGVAAVATMAVNPSLEGRYFSLWLDMPTPTGTRAGYELRFTDVAANLYTVTLAKWVGGSQAVLVSQPSYSFANGSSLALVDQGGTVSAWTNTGSGFNQLLAAADSTFSGGSAGLEGAGNIARLTNFKAGALLKLPVSKTEAASAIKTDQATLKATVNPEGTNASYQFEYGKTSAYGSKVPVSAKAIGSGTSDVSVSEAIGGLEPSTSYHFRVVASNEVGTTNGEDATFRTDAAVSTTKLGGMATTEPFDGGTASLASFGANWSALGWAAGSPAKGEDTSTGWRPVAAYPSNHGASYNPTITDTGLGVAAVATMAVNPSLEGRYFSLWLDMPTPTGTRAGYELRFTDVAANLYTVTLAKWVGGSQAVLVSQPSYSFANGSSLALVDQGGTVSAWTNTGSGFNQLLAAADSTFSGGSAGLEGAGNIARLTNFKAGALLDPVPNMDAALKGLSVNDSFATNELPLSGAGAWLALAWDSSFFSYKTGWVSGGWGPYDGYPTINGAYWQQTAFGDSGAGNAVAASLSANPTLASRYFSLWLDMPSPATARSGYELRFTEVTANTYDVALAKWVTGSKTVLASKSSYVLALGDRFALVDKAGVLSAWTRTGSEFTQILSAADTSFISGYAGVEGSGNFTRLADFSAAPLPPF